MSASTIANPAASHCVSIGGKYDLKTSNCTLSDGSIINAWDLLRASHSKSVQLANPAATYCLKIGGSYQIQDGDHGKVGICKKPDGTVVDAWALFRAEN